MGKVNTMTQANASKKLDRLIESAKPSKALMHYVERILFRNSRFLFQYKDGNVRMGYCTNCKKDFVLEPSKLRTVTYEQYQVLETKHNQSTVCPECGGRVTKRYAGFNHKPIYAYAAEFKIDRNGALILYTYRFTYRLDLNYKNDIEWVLYQVGYFDLNKWFYVLYGYGYHAYTGNKYASKLYFTTNNILMNPFNYRQDEYEGIHIMNFDVYKKSNLKYSCLDEFKKSVYPLYKYLAHYCAYPEITEKVVKECGIKAITCYLEKHVTGAFNFRAKTVPEYFKLSKQTYNTWLKNEVIDFRLENKLKAMQFFKKNKLKYDEEFYNFLIAYSSGFTNDKIRVISKMLKYTSFGKAKKYMREQAKILENIECCNPMYKLGNIQNKEDSYKVFFSTYSDYLSLAKELDMDLSNKDLLMPDNLQLAHREQNEIIARRKREAELKEKANQKKKEEHFIKKQLPKLQEKYCFTDGNLFIRPAEDYKDLQQEATAQTNCVFRLYSDKYILQRSTDILFIRHCDSPNESYYTVEFKNGAIIQCRTKHNAGQNDEVKAFCEKWLAYLKSNKKNSKKEVA